MDHPFSVEASIEGLVHKDAMYTEEPNSEGEGGHGTI